MALFKVATLAVLCQVVSVTGADDKSSESPLDKVLTLLTEMKTQVEKDTEQDRIAYEKYQCLRK